MKKSFMTRVLAVTLSAAMAFSLSSASNLVTASAATTSLTLSATDKTVDVDTRMVFKLAGSQASKWKVVNAATKDDAVAHLDRFTKKAVAVEAKSAGSTRLHVRVEKSKGKNAGKQKVLHADITVNATDATLTSVTQTKAAELSATLSAEVDSVKAADFTVVRDEGTVTIPVKSAVVDATDKTKVTITTYADMKDGKEYTVTYTNPNVEDADKKTSTAKFTATDGKVADLGLSTYTVTAGVKEEVDLQTLDAAGIVLNSYSVISAANEGKIDFSIIPANGYMESEKLYLPTVGNTATAKATYHTYTYENGVEKDVITKEFTITAVAETASMSTWAYTITDGTAPSWDSSSYKQNTQLAIGDSSKVFFRFKDSKGTNKTANGYVVSSSDTAVMIINEGTILNDSTGINIRGVKAGNAYIVVKNNAGDVVTTLPVNVTESRKATTLVPNPTSITLSNTQNSEAKKSQTKTVGLTLRDQYSSSMTMTLASGDSVGTNTIKIECLNAPSTAILNYIKTNMNTFVSPSLNTAKTAVTGVTVVGSAFADLYNNGITSWTGTYTFKVTHISSGVSTTFNTIIAQPSSTATPTYEIIFESGLDASNTVDLAVTSGSAVAAKQVAVRLGVFKGGVLDSYSDAITSVSVTNPNGAAFTNVSNTTSSASITLATVSGSGILKKATTNGTYSVTLNANPSSAITLTKTFTVKDSQVIPSITVNSTSSGGTLVDIFENQNYVVFTLDSNKLNVGKTLTNQYDAKVAGFTSTSAGSSTYYVTNVTLEVKLGVTAGYGVVYITVPVNKTFTNVSGTGL